MDPVEIFIYDVVFSGDAAGVIQQVRTAGQLPIDLHINSPGGDLFDGYAIYNALLAHVPGVTVYVDGLAGSIASYIAMAGRKIVMAENAMLFIHNPRTSAGGTAEEMRRMADMLEKCEASIVAAYVRRTKLPDEQVAAMLDAETWLTADMALAMGFVDEVGPSLEVSARFDMSKFPNAPKALLQKITNQLMNPFKTVIALLVAALPGISLADTADAAAVETQVRALVTARDEIKTKVTNFTKSLVVALKAALPSFTLADDASPENISAGVVALVTDRDSLRTRLADITKSVVAALTLALPGKVILTEASPLNEVENAIKLLVGDRDGLALQVTNITAAQVRATKHVGLLEAFAKSKGLDIAGIDPDKAITAPIINPVAKATVTEWERKMRAARTPQDRAKVSAEFEKAVTDGNVAPAEITLT